MGNLDREARRRLAPQRDRQMTEPAQSPVELLNQAAALLEQHAPASSEARSTAEKLRRLVRQWAQAQRR